MHLKIQGESQRVSCECLKNHGDIGGNKENGRTLCCSVVKFVIAGGHC